MPARTGLGGFLRTSWAARSGPNGYRSQRRSHLNKVCHLNICLLYQWNLIMPGQAAQPNLQPTRPLRGFSGPGLETLRKHFGKTRLA